MEEGESYVQQGIGTEELTEIMRDIHVMSRKANKTHSFVTMAQALGAMGIIESEDRLRRAWDKHMRSPDLRNPVLGEGDQHVGGGASGVGGSSSSSSSSRPATGTAANRDKTPKGPQPRTLGAFMAGAGSTGSARREGSTGGKAHGRSPSRGRGNLRDADKRERVRSAEKSLTKMSRSESVV